MAKYYLHNSSYKESSIVIIGVADASGSMSSRKKGVEKAPDYIRKVSRKMDVFGKNRKAQSELGFVSAKICDLGNIKKKLLANKIEAITKDGKIPIVLGGDHSITAQAINGVNKFMSDVSLIYFDAHPDYRCGAGRYYGSVLCEVEKLKNVDLKKSVLIGMRVPERTELANLKKSKMLVITPSDIESKGVNKIFQIVRKRIGKRKLYVSIDMDVVDSFYSLGVDTPVPAGIIPSQLIYFVQQISKLNLIGADICEVNPKFDLQNQTGHLASRIIAEIIGSVKR